MSSNRLDRSALLISNLLCPPAVAGMGMLLAAALQPTPQRWGYAAAYIVLAICVPLLVLFCMLYRGCVSDLDVTQRHERLIPFITALGGAAAACGYLYYIEAPQLLLRFAIAHTAVMTLVFLITLYWKISVHSAGIAGVAAFFSSLIGFPLLVFALVLLVGWSRVHLGRHTVGQVCAGGVLGGLIFTLIVPTL